MDSNIYYHFFDRELRQSVYATFTDQEILEIICVSIFMTDQFFYMPISNLYESCLDYPKSLEYINKMDKIGLIYPASSHESIENFLLSRQHLYQHDKDRYPMYFGEKINIWSNNLLILEDSTTELLRDKFSTSKIEIPEFSKSNQEQLKKYIYNTIEESDQKAITFSLFKEFLAKETFSSAEMRLVVKHIKKSISKYYTDRYLEVGKGTIITGVPQLKEYDSLAKDQYQTNFEIYKYILQKVGVNFYSQFSLELILLIRQDLSDFLCINLQLSKLIKCICNLVSNQTIGKMKRINRYLYEPMSFKEIANSKELLNNIYVYIDSICNRSEDLKIQMSKTSDTEKGIVILAVTYIEMKELLFAIGKHCPQVWVREKFTEDLVYRELIGCKLPVYIVQTQMGLTGTGSIINIMHKVCKNLNPSKVVMGGIAFGSDRNKQNIGDILVSKQVWNYEPAKIKSSDTISRGDKNSASSFLIQLFQSSAIEYNDAEIHFGLFASGEKLVNSREFLDDLKNQEIEIIGGDMEAAGLASVCIEKKIEWLVVKAICDWGYEKDDSGQKLAAHNAFDFIMYNLKKIII